jgi:quercetin dioxygenase-like cupin family protein
MRLAAFAFTAMSITACASAPTGANAAWTDGASFTAMGATNPGAFSAMLDGSTSAAAPYTIRVHMTEGGRIMPHTHPDPRVVTVVDGELCYGFSDTFDPAGCKLYPEGSYFVVPANVPHFGYGKSDAVYQESGVGPSGFVPVTAPAE